MSSVCWVTPWEPSPHLRPARHQFNNLLAPLVVAAELLDDGSETADLLTRAVDRIRDASNRLGELLHLGSPLTRSVTVDEITAFCGLPPADGASGRAVRVDPERFLCNVVAELRALLAGPDGSEGGLSSTVSTDDADWFRVTVTLPRRFTVTDPSVLAVPFAVPGADVRLATLCRETHLHAGRVAFDVTTAELSVHLPLA